VLELLLVIGFSISFQVSELLPGAGVFIVFLPFRETLFVWKELNFSVF
jgi:hypothetical protein